MTRFHRAFRFVPALLLAAAASHAVPTLIATGSIAQDTDLSGLHDILENGVPDNILGGIGSGLAYAGGTTFLAVPDRGPNATTYAGGDLIDNTDSYISRFETLDLSLTPAASGGLPYTLTPTLLGTTLLYSHQSLYYGSTPGLPSAVPPANTRWKHYFTGRSDDFGPGLSTDPLDARLDPEAIRVAKDGNSVFIGDEYGPYVYQFDRATGRRLRSFKLPNHFAVKHLSSLGDNEIADNDTGRVANKGMEGLAISPDGKTLAGFIQSPLIQDGGNGGRCNRIVTIDIASGATHEYVYDNLIAGKTYNSSEMVALNDHQFLVLERDGKGLGDGSKAKVKQVWEVDIAGAHDVSNLAGEDSLLPYAAPKKLFLNIAAQLEAFGIPDTLIPSKIEGMAFGADIRRNDSLYHTLYIGNDNDFVPATSGPSLWYVFAFTDADLAADSLSYTPQEIIARGPDLSLRKTASSRFVITGSDVRYALTVRNQGLVPATNVSLLDALPAGLDFVSCVSTGVCSGSGNSRAVQFPSLNGAASQTAWINAMLSCAVPNGTRIVNVATANMDVADPSPGNDSATAGIVAVNPAPVIRAVSAAPAVLPANGQMVPVRVNYAVRDNCDGSVCSLQVFSNDHGAAAGSDGRVLDDHNVLLRAEANTNGNRFYSIPISCKDSGGATSVRGVSVEVLANHGRFSRR